MNQYVTDTQALLWHLMRSRKLSQTARKIFRGADAGKVQIVVPSIVLVETVYIFQRSRVPQGVLDHLFSLSEEADANYRIMPLNLAVARTLRDFGPAAIPEMPDRIVAATARTLNLPLLTVDPTITESKLVQVIWR